MSAQCRVMERRQHGLITGASGLGVWQSMRIRRVCQYSMNHHQPIDLNYVPYVYRPVVFRSAVVAAVCIWLLMVRLIPDLRPGIIEALIALSCAYVVAGLTSSALVQLVARLALAYRDRPWMVYIPVGDSEAWRGWVQASAVVAFSTWGVMIAVLIGYYLAPHLGLPWARYAQTMSDEWPIRSIMDALIVYVPALVILTSVHMLHWYGRARDCDSLSTGLG